MFTPEIRQQVKEIIGSETNTLTKARKIFRLVSDNIPWNAEDEYCIISYFAKKGFMARRAGRAATNSDPATTGDARLVGNLCRAVGLVAGRCVLWLARIRRQAHRRILLRPSGQLPHGCEPRLWPRTVPAENALYSEPANFQRGEVEVDGRNL